MQRTIKGIINVCLERTQGMIHIPLGADIIVLTDDSRENRNFSILFAPSFLSMRMVFKLSHKK
jgi:hypothetical protein